MDSKICPTGTDGQGQVQDNWPESAMPSDQRTKLFLLSMEGDLHCGPTSPMTDLFKQAKEDTKPTQEFKGQFCYLLNTKFPTDLHLEQTHCKPIKIMQQ